MHPYAKFLTETVPADAKYRLRFVEAWARVPDSGLKQVENGASLRFQQRLARSVNEIANRVGVPVE